MADLLLINARVTTLDRANPVAEAVAQWRASTSDAVYAQPNIPVPHTAGQDGAWTAGYGQLRADLRIGANLTAAVEAVRFDIGQTPRRAGGARWLLPRRGGEEQLVGRPAFGRWVLPARCLPRGRPRL